MDQPFFYNASPTNYKFRTHGASAGWALYSLTVSINILQVTFSLSHGTMLEFPMAARKKNCRLNAPYLFHSGLEKQNSIYRNKPFINTT